MYKGTYVPLYTEGKDTVFRMLFGKKKNLLELYNGLNGTDYKDEEALEIYTLENAVYMGMKNDVSFLLMSELNLYEHQASQNPNMPLRDLLYIERQYEKYIKGKSLYTGKLLKIPTPNFVVFYNGGSAQPERRILKLSDSFETKTDDPKLELKVLQLNINDGKNKALMERCRTLREYSQYVACVRKHTKAEPIEQAVDHAVTECIHRGILKEFLQGQRAEVVAMSIFEYDEEEEKRKLREAEFEYGREEGHKAGLEEGIKDGLILMQKLVAAGRAADAEKAVADKAYRQQLLEEFGLNCHRAEGEAKEEKLKER